MIMALRMFLSGIGACAALIGGAVSVNAGKKKGARADSPSRRGHGLRGGDFSWANSSPEGPMSVALE
jgi:hypothetical protein